MRGGSGQRGGGHRRRRAEPVHRRRQVPALHVHVPGVAMRRRTDEAAAACVGEPRAHSRHSPFCRTTSWTPRPSAGASRRRTPSSSAGIASTGMPGSAERFGESAAILLGDMCLVWAEQMLRSSGVGADALDRVWPRYDRCAPNWRWVSSPTSSTSRSQLPTSGTGARHRRAKVRQLHGAATPGDRCGDGRMRRTVAVAAGAVRHGRRRSLPAARRPARRLRNRCRDRQADRRRHARTQGHQRGRGRLPAGRRADAPPARRS